MKIGINGLGRIGRIVTRIITATPDLQLVAINSRSEARSHAHLLMYDSTYGKWDAKVSVHESTLCINGQSIQVLQKDHPDDISWGDYGVDVVLECTGKFRSKEDVQGHINNGAQKVILATPGKEVDATLVMGVNESTYEPTKHHIISNASCTTNCLAPLMKVIDESHQIQSGSMTTVHAITNDQNILDNSHHKDLRRARTAHRSIIPTSTGATKALGLLFPHLQEKLCGMALRVPTDTVSFVDVVLHTGQLLDRQDVLHRLQQAQGDIIQICTEPLVSVDLVGNNHSAIVDAELLQIVDDYTLKLCAWYDNERGYAQRLVDLTKYILSY